MKTKFQPTLPPEQPFTDAELAFLDESPPGLFPENQDSNFGFIIRKIFSDHVQDVINQTDTIYNEHFVDTSDQFLPEWELQVGLPQNPPGLTIQQRRNLILNKLRVGPWTRARRDAIVASFVAATLGDAAQLTPQGLALDASGIPLYSGLTSLTNAYTITENISGFSYTITVAQGITLDTVALTRELNRVQPAGLSFTVVTAAQTNKSSQDFGVGSQAQSMQAQNVILSQDVGHDTEAGIIAPSRPFASDSGLGSDSALTGYGAGAYGQSAYGGSMKVTGTARISLSAISTPSTTEQVILRVRARKANVSDAGLLAVYLYQGTTQIEGPYYITLGDAFTTDNHVVRNANLISNWSALEVRVQAIATNTGGNVTAQVSFVELQAAV